MQHGVIYVVVSDLGASNVAVSPGIHFRQPATRPLFRSPAGGSHNVVANYAGDANSALSVSSLISREPDRKFRPAWLFLSQHFTRSRARTGAVGEPDRDRYSFEQWGHIPPSGHRDLL